MILSPLLSVIVLFVGALIGGVGIGGVLLVPSLNYFGGIPIHGAIAACMVGYIITGAVGAIIYARHGTINWSLAGWVCLGAIPGAYFGAFLLPFFSSQVLEFIIGLLIVASGIQSLRGMTDTQENKNLKNGIRLLVIGFVAGVGSSLTGTGGPLMLIPILMWCKAPVLTAIGLSQVIQIPISLMATLGNYVHGEVDFKLGLTLAVLLAIGSFVGAKTAHMLPISFLKKLVSVLLVGVGTMMLVRLILQL